MIYRIEQKDDLATYWKFDVNDKISSDILPRDPKYNEEDAHEMFRRFGFIKPQLIKALNVLKEATQ